MKITHLTNRSVIALSGTDAKSLLQGIITQDVNLLEKTPLIFSALLNPQGKFLCDFFLQAHEDHILMDIDQSYQEECVKTLKRYRLRSDVTIETHDDISVYALWGDDTSEYGHPDPRLPKLGWRAMTANDSLEPNATLEEYNQHRYEQHVPDGTRDSTERSFIMELGYDQLNAISFTKGCYVGQEVTARMHYRKSLKKCLFAVQSDHDALPEFGTPILQDGVEIGEMRSSQGNRGFALIKQADFNENAAHLSANQEISLHVPAYMQAKLIDIQENAAS